MEDHALERAPDFCLTDYEGRKHSLQSHRGHPLLLVFVRHYACPCCRAHLLLLEQHRKDLQSIGIDVLVVTFERPERARAYARELGVSFPILSDSERRVYRLYGLGVVGPPSHSFIRSLLDRLSATGGEPEEDSLPEEMRQLGGDFILDAEGLMRFAYCSRYPSDRPAVTLLLAILRGLARLLERNARTVPGRH